MRQPFVLLAALVGAVIVAAGVVLVIQASGDGGGSSISPPRASMTVVSTSVRPAAPHFGEPVVAELVVVGDKAAVDPATVRVTPDFSPYEPIGPREVRRTETATRVRWHFRFAVRCLKEGCAPEGSRRTMDFPGAAVVYRFRSAPGPSTAIVDWPEFEVTARVRDDALAPEKWRADVTSLPAVSYQRSPTTLAAALVGGSVVLALIGVVLVWFLARPREIEALQGPEPEVVSLTPLERALQLAREAALDGDSPERRKAFERVARELGAEGFPGLADRARALAWSAGPANAAAVDELVRDMHAAVNGGRG
jgi:hypothetical protein